MSFCITVVQDLKELARRFDAKICDSAFDLHIKRSQKDPKTFKEFSKLGRVYPNYWAPILCLENGERVIRPMRYRLRPHWAKEDLPSKYSLNTARLDTLKTSKIWSKVFDHHHGLLVYKSFLEWVTDPETGKRALVSFKPKDFDYIWAPVIFDRSKLEKSKEDFLSFAMITHDPTPEILKAGYDRCPVFLKEEKISEWLNTDSSKKIDHIKTLLNIETVYFENKKIR